MSRADDAGGRHCWACGADHHPEAALCPACGVPADRSSAGAPDGTDPAATVHCRACGAALRRASVVCPACGVAPRRADDGASDAAALFGGGDPVPAPTDVGTGSDPDTDPDPDDTGPWAGLVVLGTALWALALLVPEAVVPGGAELTAVLVAWLALPVGVYSDAPHVGAVSEWAPDRALWTAGAALPVAGFAVGLCYLYKRARAVPGWPPGTDGEPPADDPDPAAADEPAVAALRRRYSAGEIDHEEFERRLDRLLGAERATDAGGTASAADPDDPARAVADDDG